MFSERFLKLRKDKGLTQKALAAEIGLTERTIQNYEAGRVPDLDELIKIADFFDCSLDYLVDRSDNPKRC